MFEFEQAINRIDHISILVFPENFDNYVKWFSDVLGVTFAKAAENSTAALVSALSWETGLEIIAPLKQEGQFWEKLQHFGEGTITLVFGVKDIDAGILRAKQHGVGVVHEVKLDGDEPWFNRLESFRELRLQSINDITSLDVNISENVPRQM